MKAPRATFILGPPKVRSLIGTVAHGDRSQRGVHSNARFGRVSWIRTPRLVPARLPRRNFHGQASSSRRDNAVMDWQKQLEVVARVNRLHRDAHAQLILSTAVPRTCVLHTVEVMSSLSAPAVTLRRCACVAGRFNVKFLSSRRFSNVEGN